MPATTARTRANRSNAKKSTGPKTVAGKAVIAANAVKHGLTAKSLLLESESPDEFHALIEALMTELKPSGRLESTLVEQIAYGIWRQRRLWRAEKGVIELENQSVHIMHEVNLVMGRDKDNQLEAKDLEEKDNPFEVEHRQEIMEEFKLLDIESVDYKFADLKKMAPNTYIYLIELANREGVAAKDLYTSSEVTRKNLIIIKKAVSKALEQKLALPRVRAIAEMIRASRMVPKSQAREKLARYQIQQDNELYKAIRVLREQQNWRMKMLDVIEN